MRWVARIRRPWLLALCVQLPMRECPLFGRTVVLQGGRTPECRIWQASVSEVLRRFLREPQKYLLARWNWKSAVLSSLFRAVIFFFANLTAGLPAAMAAMSTELIFRGITSGFYGALTEGFREAEPPWAAAVGVLIVLPFANHSMEFVVHWLRGTCNLVPSITASLIFTALSTLFN